MMGCLVWTVVTREIFLYSTGTQSADTLDCVGQTWGASRNHGSAFHHSPCSMSSVGIRPLEAQSTGFLIPEMWFQWSGGISSMINETLFPTKDLNRGGFPGNQLRTIVPSVHAKMLFIGNWNTSLAWWSNWTSTGAPQSPKRGIDRRLLGATLVLDMTNEVCTFRFESTIRMYTMPTYASSEESLKPCSWTEMIFASLGE